MSRLHEQLKYFVNQKLNSDPLWQRLKVILSGHVANPMVTIVTHWSLRSSGTKHSCYMPCCDYSLPPSWVKHNHEPQHGTKVHLLSLDQLVQGLCKGVLLDAFFASLKHVPHTVYVAKKKVRVFQQASQGDNFCLKILPRADLTKSMVHDIAAHCPLHRTQLYIPVSPLVLLLAVCRAAIALLDMFISRFPRMFEYLNSNPKDDMYYEADLFPEPDGCTSLSPSVASGLKAGHQPGVLEELPTYGLVPVDCPSDSHH
eukprot:Em0008g1098a